jgi:uncharacterized membrane protein
MTWWILAIVASYFCFALAALGDKIVLSKSSEPKYYTFFVGLFSGLAVLIIPFVEFSIPQGIVWLWIILGALFYIAGLYYFFDAIKKFDLSKIVPTVGAFQPIFIALISLLFWKNQGMSGFEITAFIILLLGGILISVEKNYTITKASLKVSFLAALFFSLDIIFSKLVFQELSFWEGFIWIKIFSFIFILIFLFEKSFRKNIFKVEKQINKKISFVFLSAQIFGGLATVLQSLAVNLVPIADLAIMNAMKGVQYVFLFVMVLLISSFFPKIVKEDLSQKIIVQRIIAIALITIGFVIFVI